MYVFWCREHYGTVQKVSVHLCFDIWAAVGVSLQFKLSVQFWDVVYEEVQGITVHASTHLHR